MERKIESRTENTRDKKEAVTFDMEAVLRAPFNQTSQMYYKRKLSVYNLTVFSLADKEVTCYVWNKAKEAQTKLYHVCTKT